MCELEENWWKEDRQLRLHRELQRRYIRLAKHALKDIAPGGRRVRCLRCIWFCFLAILQKNPPYESFEFPIDVNKFS